jgi:transposase
VDLSSGALLAVTLEPANEGDTTTLHKTLAEAQAMARLIHPLGVEELVADKGYHSGEVLKELHVGGVRSCLPEPLRGKRHWQGRGVEQKQTYEYRRRVRGARGKRLQKMRSELTERTFAHLYETGGMRRVHLRGWENILKRAADSRSRVQSVTGAAKNAGIGQTKRAGRACKTATCDSSEGLDAILGRDAAR